MGSLVLWAPVHHVDHTAPSAAALNSMKLDSRDETMWAAHMGLIQPIAWLY